MAQLSFIKLSRYWWEQNKRRWLRPLAVFAIVFLSAALPLKASRSQLTILLALFPAAGATLALLRWPNLTLIAIIGSVAIPVNGPSGFNLTTALVAVALGLWLLDIALNHHKIELLPGKPVWSVIFLISAASLAFGVGQLPWYTFARQAPLGAQLGGLALFFLSAGAFLVVGHRVRDLRWLEWMTWTLLALGAVYVFGKLPPGTDQILDRVFALVINGSLFWAWLAVLAFSQAMFNRRLGTGWRLALIALVLATFYELYVQKGYWKSGWVPALAGIVAILALRSWRLALVVALGGLALVPGLASKLIASDQYSYSTRVEAWLIVVEIIKVNPILGLGPANYYWYTPLFPIRGYAVSFNSHSQYVDLIAQTGLLGLVCFLWFAGTVGWLGWRLRDKVPAGFPQAYVYGALGGLAATLVAGALGDWVLPFFYNVGFSGFRASVLAWLFLGGLVALEHIFASNTHRLKRS